VGANVSQYPHVIEDKILAKEIVINEETLGNFWRKVVPDLACWHYKGNHDSQGYSIFWYGGQAYKAHRIMYTLIWGRIPDDLVLDHLCRNRWCVNPYHLEAVTSTVNILRGENVATRNIAKTECRYGHALAGVNLSKDYAGRRRCLTCARRRNREYMRRIRAEQRSAA
jgi:hypothetical protein